MSIAMSESVASAVSSDLFIPGGPCTETRSSVSCSYPNSFAASTLKSALAQQMFALAATIVLHVLFPTDSWFTPAVVGVLLMGYYLVTIFPWNSISATLSSFSTNPGSSNDTLLYLAFIGFLLCSAHFPSLAALLSDTLPILLCIPSFSTAACGIKLSFASVTVAYGYFLGDWSIISQAEPSVAIAFICIAVWNHGDSSDETASLPLDTTGFENFRSGLKSSTGHSRRLSLPSSASKFSRDFSKRPTSWHGYTLHSISNTTNAAPLTKGLRPLLLSSKATIPIAFNTQRKTPAAFIGYLDTLLFGSLFCLAFSLSYARTIFSFVTLTALGVAPQTEYQGFGDLEDDDTTSLIPGHLHVDKRVVHIDSPKDVEASISDEDVSASWGMSGAFNTDLSSENDDESSYCMGGGLRRTFNLNFTLADLMNVEDDGEEDHASNSGGLYLTVFDTGKYPSFKDMDQLLSCFDSDSDEDELIRKQTPSELGRPNLETIVEEEEPEEEGWEDYDSEEEEVNEVIAVDEEAEVKAESAVEENVDVAAILEEDEDEGEDEADQGEEEDEEDEEEEDEGEEKEEEDNPMEEADEVFEDEDWDDPEKTPTKASVRGKLQTSRTTRPLRTAATLPLLLFKHSKNDPRDLAKSYPTPPPSPAPDNFEAAGKFYDQILGGYNDDPFAI